MQHWDDIPCGLPLRLLVCLGDGPEGLEKGVKFVFINDALVLKTGIIQIKKAFCVKGGDAIAFRRESRVP